MIYNFLPFFVKSLPFFVKKSTIFRQNPKKPRFGLDQPVNCSTFDLSFSLSAFQCFPHSLCWISFWKIDNLRFLRKINSCIFTVVGFWK